MSDIESLLRSLLESSRALKDTLAKEHEALLSANLSTLSTHSERKKNQLIELEALELNRRRYLEVNDWESIEASGSQPLVDLWSQVLEELRACQEANEINGAIVRAHQARTQKALDLLAGRGLTPAEYSPDGLADAKYLSEEIARA